MSSVAFGARASTARQAAGVLWRFARPHTIIGTVCSIAGIYVIAADQLPDLAIGERLDHLWWVLVAGVCVNVAIVGINQVEDVEIDRVNKPWLPIAAGDLSPAGGRRIVAAAALLAMGLALSQGLAESLAVGTALAIGWAYSVPPLRLKRFAIAAAFSIASVRALVVHLGVFLHFSDGGLADVPAPVWALTLFVLPFSLAIAVLKDVPDAEGDRRFQIATFTVRAGPRRVVRAGVALLVLAYAGMAAAAPWIDGAQPVVLAGTHLAALAVLLRWTARLDSGDPAAVAVFYQRVWKLFFAEYVLVPAACLLG